MSSNAQFISLDLTLENPAPSLKLPQVPHTRSGFFADWEFAACCWSSPPTCGTSCSSYGPPAWQRDEGRLLTWSSVDRKGGIILLEEARSKRVSPARFTSASRNGQSLGIGTVRAAWKRATKRAGLGGMLVHDLRRTTARDFRSRGCIRGRDHEGVRVVHALDVRPATTSSMSPTWPRR